MLRSASSICSSPPPTFFCVLSHVQLFATAWTVCSLPGSSVHGILQALQNRMDRSWGLKELDVTEQLTLSLFSLLLGRGFFTPEPPGKPIHTYNM